MTSRLKLVEGLTKGRNNTKGMLFADRKEGLLSGGRCRWLVPRKDRSEFSYTSPLKVQKTK